MRRIWQVMTMAIAAAIAVALLGAGSAGAAGTNLLANPGVEVGTAGAPDAWTFGAWSSDGLLQATGTWSSTAAHSGSRSLRVDLTQYGGDGDAKWWSQPVAVTGGAYYSLSDWYRSNLTTAISIEYWTGATPPNTDLTPGSWMSLTPRVAPASSWTQYQTGFVMPADATYASVAQLAMGVGGQTAGYLETDDYALVEQPTPAGFATPMVSLTFDDGTQSFYDHARPLLDAHAFRTTEYVPSSFVGTAGYMTTAELSALADAGHEIGSHTVTHADLTSLTDAQLASELRDSRTALQAISGVGVVTSLAPPYGYFDSRALAAAQAAGYSSARSVEDGYNTAGGLDPYDLHVQNMTSTTTAAQFQSWVTYAKAHDYWLIVVYHKVMPDDTPACGTVDPSVPCLGPYDTTVSQFSSQLAYLHTAGLDASVKTVKQALNTAIPPSAGTVAITPAQPDTNAIVQATPSGFSDLAHSTLTYTYTWRVNGTLVAGATGATFDLAPSGHGDHGDIVSVSVIAHDPWGNQSAAAGASVVVANGAPLAGAVTLSPTAPGTTTVLTAAPVAFTDPDSDQLTYTFQWKVNGTVVAGATGPTFDLTPATHGDRGDAVSVTVIAHDPAGAQSAAAGASVVVVNSAPLRGSAVISPTAPRGDAVLTATPVGFSDPDGDQLTYAFQWKVNGAVIADATGATLDLSQPGHGDNGDSVSVHIVARDPMGAQSAAADAGVVIGNSAPLAGSATLSPPAPGAGAVVTATPVGFSDPDGDALTYEYQWQVNGTAVTDSAGATLDLSQPGHGAHGDIISVTIAASDGRGGRSQAVSASAVIANTAPTTGSVTITPAAPTGGTELAATVTGFSDADGDALTYSYTWFADGQAITGAVGSTLPASAVSAGATIRVEVTAGDGQGGTSAPASASVTVAATPAPAPTLDQTPPRAVIAAGTLRKRGGAVSVTITCPAGQSYCDGTVVLSTVQGHRVLVLGRAHVHVASGVRKSIRISLSSSVLKRLRNAISVPVTVRLTATDAAGLRASVQRRTRLYLRLDATRPAVRIETSRLTSSGGAATVTLTCPAGQSHCDGTVTIRTAEAGRSLTLGSSRFHIARERTAAVRIGLSSGLLARFRPAGSVRVVISVGARNGAGSRGSSQRAAVLAVQRPQS